MKILNLRFKNLNSLIGEWSIDFTAPEYVGDGIFAITGPTGAGKSTILDAICLALYGRTPRLKSITKNSNEIMSRQTGECFAEVTFATQAGKFICHWSQHRARKKPDGKLSDSKHEIADAVGGQVLESRKRDVAVAIEEKTGMDFDRFTRSMLLAQGGFAAFLQAAPDDRAPILEQITGSKIYSEISKHIHERHRDEHAKLELLRAENAGIIILTDENEALLKLELHNQQKTEKTLETKNEALKKTISRLTGIAALKSELLEINKESEASTDDLKAFVINRKKLQRALKATELENEYATLKAKKQEQKSDLELLTTSKTQLPKREQALDFKETALRKSEKTLLRVKVKQKSELELIKKVREFDYRISEKQSALKSDDSDCQKLKVQLSEKIEQRQKSVTIQDSERKKLLQIEDYLSINAFDAALLTELTGINAQLKNLEAVSDSVATIKSLLADLNKQTKLDNARHKKQQTLCLSLQRKQAAAQKQVSLTNTAMAELLGDRPLQEYRTELDGRLREMAYLAKIISLEDERLKLKESKPCPLCGALHHPFAEGNIPKIDDTEKKIDVLATLIRKTEELENDLQKHNSKEKKSSLVFAESEKELIRIAHKKDESDADLQRAEKELLLSLKKQTELNNSTLSALEPFGLEPTPGINLGSISEVLAIRLKKWQDYQSRKAEIENKSSVLTTEIKSLEAIILTLNDALKEKQTVQDKHKNELDNLTTERQGLYGQKDPDREERRAEEQVVETEKFRDATRESLDQIRLQLNDVKSRITALQENISKREPELDKLEPSFVISCKKAGFEDEQRFISSRLAPEKRDKLARQAKELDDRQAEITTRKKAVESRLAQETAKKIGELSLDDLKRDQTASQKSLKKLGEEIGAIKQKLNDNKMAKSRHQEQQLIIEARKKESAKWDALHSLIGSADGKKYRNFAQGLTFELMVSHANQQLEKMSDRYLLVRDHKQPLELNVIDYYQAGEIRSTKNLSGGESFIVSLALALGLSKMASRKVRVDSLFLDEGFGTLDEEALETALETLAGLQQGGKLIGVISHISALKERISTQITVQPVTGGKSTIQGPGCVKKIEVDSWAANG
ncbi:MAG: AAA family ATPase [Deltaproteobacteria bacterium]|nr:AAA family ATPase [Deltaproteobacteria bacterium]